MHTGARAHTHTHTRWGTVSSFSCTHLLGDLAGAVDELLFGEAVVGAALERPGFGDQACAAVAQLRHLLLNVGANLQRATGANH